MKCEIITNATLQVLQLLIEVGAQCSLIKHMYEFQFVLHEINLTGEKNSLSTHKIALILSVLDPRGGPTVDLISLPATAPNDPDLTLLNFDEHVE